MARIVVVAVHARHHDVRQHEVDVGLCAEMASASGAALGHGDVGAAALEQRGQREDVAEVVVDHEDLAALERREIVLVGLLGLAVVALRGSGARRARRAGARGIGRARSRDRPDGRKTVNVLPAPGVLDRAISPPSMPTSSRLIDSPSPVPP